ncbi:uncharacterized protein LOC134284518 [Aedes albopictus]|uniref:CCHC-type domain-containing protein n=1 Tax=Aedes albopictus TaxID=7160 RepID=A0ABM1YFM9_AEDAL
MNEMMGKCDSILFAVNEIKNRLEKIENKLERSGCDEAVKQCEKNVTLVVEESAKLHGEQLKVLETQIANSTNNSPAVGNGPASAVGDEYPSAGSFVEVVRRKKRNQESVSVLRSGRVRNNSVATPNNNETRRASARAQQINNSSAVDVVDISGTSSNKKFGCTVRVKPIATQSNHQTKKEVRSKIDPSQMGIKSVRNGMNGSIIVECGNVNEAEGLVKAIKDKFNGAYSADIEQPRRPKIKILGVTGNYESNELMEILSEQNGIEDVQFLKVLKCIPSKKNSENEYSLICEVDAKTFELVMRKGKLNIDFERCRVMESVNLFRCFKCCGFGHKSTECKNNLHCAKCAKSHDVKDCSSDQEFCVNCIYSNKERKTQFDINHSSWSVDCPIYLKKVSISKSFINYDA